MGPNDVPKLPEVWVYWAMTIDPYSGAELWKYVLGTHRPILREGDPRVRGPINITSAAAAEAVREFAETHEWELPVGAVDEFCKRKGFKTLADHGS